MNKITPLMWLRYRIVEARKRGVYSHFANECECIFIHIPKAAGTSVAVSLFGKESRHVPYFEYKRINPRKYNRFFKFAFVRNPWDRLVSSYYFLLNGGLNDDDAKWARENLGGYPNFKVFITDWISEENIWSWVHFLPQHHFICDDDGNVMVDFVGRLENIEDDFSYVAKRLGSKKELDKVNIGGARNYQDFYDKETMEIVADIYAKDIRLFNYTFD